MSNLTSGGKRLEALKKAGVKIPKESGSAEGSVSSKDEMRRMALEIIDDFMRHVGIEDPSKLTDEEGRRYFACGSARGIAGIVEMEDELFLRVQAHMMPLPSDKELILPLMRELLAANYSLPGMAKLAMTDSDVFACVMLSLNNITSVVFFQAIGSAMSMADYLDDILIKKYGGTSLNRS